MTCSNDGLKCLSVLHSFILIISLGFNGLMIGVLRTPFVSVELDRPVRRLLPSNGEEKHQVLVTTKGEVIERIP